MNDLATTTEAPNAGTFNVLTNPTTLQAMVTFAEMMSKAVVTVPQHLQGKPADCMAIAMQAAQWGMNPFAVAQKTHLINGKLGYEAQLIVAVLQATRTIVGAPHYEYTGTGSDLACRVGMVLAGEAEPRWTQWLRNGDVKTRNSALWQTHPSQQLGYRQVAYWARQYAPGAILGVYTSSELEDEPAAGERYMGEADVVEPKPGPKRRSETAAPAPAPAAAPAPASTVIDAATGEVVSTPPPEPERPTPPAAAGSLTGGQVAYLRNKLKAAGIGEPAICNRFEVDALELLAPEQFATLKAELLAAA